MHVADGVLSGPVLMAGTLGAAAGVAWGVHRLRAEEVPRAALLSAAFFVASLVHLKLGVVSVHLVFSGLLGLLLGWAAFPAILLGLLLQLVMFGHGGLTTLGVNVVLMATPAVLLGGIWRRFQAGRSRVSRLGAGICGALAVAGSGVLLALALWFSERSFVVAAQAVLVAHVPIMLIEGVVTASAVHFLQHVQPAWRGDSLTSLTGRV